MAQVYYFANVSTNGTAWSGYFDVTSLSSTANTDLPSSIVVTSPQSFSFSPLVQAYYPSMDYITWRTYLGPSQYPDSGYSFDIWSADFLNNIVTNNFTWTQMINHIGVFGQGFYDLRTDKYTVIYNYDVPCSVQAGRGGYLQLSTTPVP